MADTVDPAFLPFDVTSDPKPERRETAHMLTFWRRGLHRDHRVTGLLSPKFSEKTAISGEIFNKFITDNPDHDVWFINPYPQYHYLAFNIWEHGDIWYPGLCERAARVFRAAGLPIDPANFPRSTKRTLLLSNYWAGTSHFWDRFMAFVSLVTEHADQESSVFDPIVYDSGKSNYFPFIGERLFTTFLTLHPEIKARYADFRFAHILDIANPTDTLLLREWGPMIDAWDRTGTYSDDQRTIFRGIQKLSILGMHAASPAILRYLLGL